ncbi:MAG: prepilin-type N-terminal cleavage/methylation domain-containing protein [bacterium]|nr:prepilin-type N-terminal cleavage/methylation domain-containing protein [bacterium]
MTTTTLSPIPDHHRPRHRFPAEPGARRRRPAGGFTLVEMMIGAALSSFILAGVLSTFLFLGRSGANMQNYSDMESQSRKALEIFAEDVRQANAIAWNSAVSVTLTVNTAAVVYEYVNAAAATSTRPEGFYRTIAGNDRRLISGITPGSCSYKAYSVADSVNPLPLVTAANLTAASSTTKQLQLSLECTRTNVTVVAATNSVLSARFILRNKIVTA